MIKTIREKDELFSIHLLKFLSIIGVVYIHGAFLLNPNVLFSDFFRFCVPVFILSSVFLSERSNNHKEIDSAFLSKRMIRLFIPFIFWSIFYYLIYTQRQTEPLKILTSHFLGYGWAGQYYFIILFQVTIIFWFFRKYNSINNIYYILIIGILTLAIYWTLFYGIYRNSIVLKLSNRLFVYWIFYILAAIWLARNYEKLKNHKYQNSILPIVLLFLIPFLIQLERTFYPISERGEEYCKVSILVASTCLFGLILMENKVSNLIRSDYLKNIVTEVSKYTMGIFCLNPFVIRILKELVNHYNLPKINSALPLITIPLIIVICISISKVLENLKLKILVK